MSHPLRDPAALAALLALAHRGAQRAGRPVPATARLVRGLGARPPDGGPAPDGTAGPAGHPADALDRLDDLGADAVAEGPAGDLADAVLCLWRAAAMERAEPGASDAAVVGAHLRRVRDAAAALLPADDPVAHDAASRWRW